LLVHIAHRRKNGVHCIAERVLFAFPSSNKMMTGGGHVCCSYFKYEGPPNNADCDHLAISFGTSAQKGYQCHYR